MKKRNRTIGIVLLGTLLIASPAGANLWDIIFEKIFYVWANNKTEDTVKHTDPDDDPRVPIDKD